MAALKGHMKRYSFVGTQVDTVPCVAIIDRGEPNTVTVMGVGEDGSVVAFRRHVAGAADPSGAIVDRALAIPDDGTDALAFSQVVGYFGGRGGTAGFARQFADAFAIANGENPLPDADLVAAAEALLRTSGASDVASRLDPAAIKALECVSSFGKGAYAFYADPNRGKIRCQAADSYPLLAGEIASRVRVKMAVDRLASPVEVLMSSFGADRFGNPKLSRALLKKMTGKRFRDGGVELESLVDYLSQMPVDWFPKDEGEWDAFVDVAATFLRRLGPEFGGDISGLVSGASGRWKDFAVRLAKAYAPTLPPEDLPPEEHASWTPPVDTSREAMAGAAESAKDVLLAFRNMVVLPAAANAGGQDDAIVGPEQRRIASDVAAKILFGGKTLGPILELQRHWHTQAPAILGAVPEDDGVLRGELKVVAEDGWPPLTDIWVAPNGVSLIPLTDPRELSAEGSSGKDENGVPGLGHCVGGYDKACRDGTSHIVSLRVVHPDGSYQRLSTAEFRAIDADTTELQKRQHYGRGNGAAPQMAAEALSWYMQEIAARRIPLNVEGVMSYIAGNRRSVEEVESYCGYEWRDANKVRQAFEPWKPYMPKRLRGIELEGVAALPEMAELVDSIAPTYARAMTR